MTGRFEGWYYKHQAGGRTLALIPGRAQDGAFIQVITAGRPYNIPYPLSEYRKGNVLRIGPNVFSASGVTLDISGAELTLRGELRYSDLTLLRRDIMGPFRFFPMECRHSVVSMRHSIHGEVTLNGEKLDFGGGTGYIEADSGRSFPDGYAWAHCNSFERECSVMASVARIPFCGFKFWGCVCAVWLGGREYRLATYNGARILRCEPGAIELRQRNLRLAITAEVQKMHMLRAPGSGRMSRVIRESLSCPARFCFTDGDTALLNEKSESASYEYEIEA